MDPILKKSYMNEIIDCWVKKSIPDNLDPCTFINPNEYLLYTLVVSSNKIRKEIKSLELAGPKFRDAIMYKRIILANLEYKIEKFLKELRSIPEKD